MLVRSFFGSAVLGTILAGSTAFLLFKQAVEGGNTGKTRLHGHFRNGVVGTCQVILRNLYAPEGKIVAKRISGVLLEKS